MLAKRKVNLFIKDLLSKNSFHIRVHVFVFHPGNKIYNSLLYKLVFLNENTTEALEIGFHLLRPNMVTIDELCSVLMQSKNTKAFNSIQHFVINDIYYAMQKTRPLHNQPIIHFQNIEIHWACLYELWLAVVKLTLIDHSGSNCSVFYLQQGN